LLGNLDDALFSLKTALDLNPKHGEAYAHVGLVLLEKGEFDGAFEYLNHALQHDPDHLMANYLMGITCKKTGRENEANKYFGAVINRYTSLANMKTRFAEGYYYIGKCHYLMGELPKAVANLKKAVEYDTEEVDYHYSFGMLYSDAEAFHALAEVLHEMGNDTEARENLKKAVELEPDNQKFQQLRNQIGV
jgi:tetratricopeptide (TPR) repeat protein